MRANQCTTELMVPDFDAPISDTKLQLELRRRLDFYRQYRFGNLLRHSVVVGVGPVCLASCARICAHKQSRGPQWMSVACVNNIRYHQN